MQSFRLFSFLRRIIIFTVTPTVITFNNYPRLAVQSIKSMNCRTEIILRRQKNFIKASSFIKLNRKTIIEFIRFLDYTYKVIICIIINIM